MKLSGYVVLFYGLIVFLGGLMGYVKAQSMVSLGTGLFFSAALFLSAAAIFKNYAAGQLGAILLSIVLGLLFLYRFWATEKFMPSGMMALISILILSILLILRIVK
jgi:uncharacterized membrane protein (UPF0136 family)